MEILDFIARISADASPRTPGFQAQTGYIALSVLAPLVVGLAVSYLLRTAQRVLGLDRSGY